MHSHLCRSRFSCKCFYLPCKKFQNYLVMHYIWLHLTILTWTDGEMSVEHSTINKLSPAYWSTAMTSMLRQNVRKFARWSHSSAARGSTWVLKILTLFPAMRENCKDHIMENRPFFKEVNFFFFLMQVIFKGTCPLCLRIRLKRTKFQRNSSLNATWSTMGNKT